MSNETLPELCKPSGCIHVDHVLSGPAQRLYNCLLAYIQDDIPNINEMSVFQVPSEIVREYLHTRSDIRIKDWLRELRRKDIEFNNICKGGPSWGCYGFIESPRMAGSYIRFSIAPELRQFMVDSNMFARINMLIEQKFKKTKYAQPLYELGLDYRNNKDSSLGKAVTPWMEVEKFRKYMGVPDTKAYKSFAALNRAIIQKALKEIKAESDIEMTLDKELEKRVVTRVRFIIEDNVANISPVERLKRIQATLPEGKNLNIEVAKLADFLARVFDVHVPRAKKIAKLYAGNETYFREVVDKVHNKQLAGEIKGKIGPFAAKVFEDENPMVELVLGEKV